MIYLYERVFECEISKYLAEKEKVEFFYTPESRYDFLCFLVDKENKPYKQDTLSINLVDHLIEYRRGR